MKKLRFAGELVEWIIMVWLVALIATTYFVLAVFDALSTPVAHLYKTCVKYLQRKPPTS